MGAIIFLHTYPPKLFIEAKKDFQCSVIKVSKMLGDKKLPLNFAEEHLKVVSEIQRWNRCYCKGTETERSMLVAPQ